MVCGGGLVSEPGLKKGVKKFLLVSEPGGLGANVVWGGLGGDPVASMRSRSICSLLSRATSSSVGTGEA